MYYISKDLKLGFLKLCNNSNKIRLFEAYASEMPMVHKLLRMCFLGMGGWLKYDGTLFLKTET